MRVLVCGSRKYTDKTYFTRILQEWVEKYPHITILTGMANGPDLWAHEFAKTHNLGIEEYPAQWDTEGRRAGFLRNERMIKTRPDWVIAFWDGVSRGTEHTINLAKTHRIAHIVYR